MTPPSLSELKKELMLMPSSELVNICIRLAKYKKENKELLGYLLFESNYELDYITRIKTEMDVLFGAMNTSNIYFAKKNIRKILRITNRYIRYSGQKQTEAELRIHFCVKLHQAVIHLPASTSVDNIFNGQILKINQTVSLLHEDLQHDYKEELRRLKIRET